MFRRLVPAVIGGALVLLVAACGSSSGTPTAAAPTSAAQPSAGRGGGPAASGTVAALAQSSLELQNASSGQVTVNYSGDTTFTNRVAAALADVTTGSCVVVTGTGTPVAAKTVEISAATAGGCTAGFGGGPGGMRPQNGTGSRAPRPSGTNGNNPAGGGRAFGTVTAVSPTGFTVRQDNRQTGATTDVQVSVDSSTTYTKSEAANSSALKVGECVAATGQTDDTGAVTAKTIVISQAGPNGCGTGRQRNGGPNAGGGTNG
ncbi:hypothetical protein HFP15_34375 [Amycolatopsis sp. K13G38]|uniref:DUF5666 domain-containing protein n=1 Tax=Amycolatopsis acididurans TaxID=2724524 RepID=A0ABX1JDV4_9PSEU|nr:DUF5666 domain-containing protein [Amycolatopsis acididurans]NKQ57960.1 hypothetical protein [Amycolatopsis acididurans]